MKSDSACSCPAPVPVLIRFAQFIRICRWLQLIHKDRLAPLENAPFSTLWAQKRYRVNQCFCQYLRATNCDKLSDLINPILRGWVRYFAVGDASRCFGFIKDWVEKNTF